MLKLILLLLLTIHPGVFVEYNVYYHFYQDCSSLQGLLIQKVLKNFPNGTSLIQEMLINLNTSVYVNTYFLDNTSSPTQFLYIPMPGETHILWGNRSFFLVSNRNFYVYYNCTNLTKGVYLKTYIYVNSTGVPEKVCFIQGSKEVVSNVTYILRESNILFNSSIFIPSNLSQAGKLLFQSEIEQNINDVVMSSLILLVLIGVFYSSLRQKFKKKYND
ncbi:hypothetical protein HS7_00020 [Sulfolobales archaeon HS-7]|nr:hypothetical protein HS7_00020 [Sulfolobales archaeon HS-7]